MKENKFRVYCEFEVNGELHKSMESPASWFLLTQTGKLWSYDPGETPRPIGKEYKVAIPLFYTGYKDVDKIEIYEGDILNGDFPDVVFWDDDRGQWMLRNSENPDDTLWEIIRDNKPKIIGNIHENPELLRRDA